MTRKQFIIIGSILTVIGFVGMAPTLYFRWAQPGSRPATPVNVAQINQQLERPSAALPTPVYGHPVRLRISNLAMNLPIVDGYYNQNNGQWTISNDKVHFAAITAKPNNQLGNTFLYGHYRPEVFSRLHKIAPGSEAVVETDNGYEFVYKLREVRETSPNDASIFSYVGPPQLTIQTCSGLWMQNRQMFMFDFVSYKKTDA